MHPLPSQLGIVLFSALVCFSDVFFSYLRVSPCLLSFLPNIIVGVKYFHTCVHFIKVNKQKIPKSASLQEQGDQVSSHTY